VYSATAPNTDATADEILLNVWAPVPGVSQVKYRMVHVSTFRNGHYWALEVFFRHTRYGFEDSRLLAIDTVMNENEDTMRSRLRFMAGEYLRDHEWHFRRAPFLLKDELDYYNGY